MRQNTLLSVIKEAFEPTREDFPPFDPSYEEACPDCESIPCICHLDDPVEGTNLGEMGEARDPSRYNCDHLPRLRHKLDNKARTCKDCRMSISKEEEFELDGRCEKCYDKKQARLDYMDQIRGAHQND